MLCNEQDRGEPSQMTSLKFCICAAGSDSEQMYPESITQGVFPLMVSLGLNDLLIPEAPLGQPIRER